MFADLLTAEIEAAPLNTLDHLYQTVNRAHGAGQLSDEQAQGLWERIAGRRPKATRAKSLATSSLVPVKRYSIRRAPDQRSPDRQRSLERRRGLAYGDHLPPGLRALWTVGERAVLKIISDEWLAHGVCDLSLNELASRAGVCRSVAKRTVQLAENVDGLISVKRRPRSGRKHLTNLIRIVRAEWIHWLNKGNRRTRAVGACKRAKPDFRLVQAMRRIVRHDPIARGVQINPPRKEVLKNNAERHVGNSGKNPWAWPAKAGKS